MKKIPFIISFFCLIVSFTFAQNSQYSIANKFHLDGEGFWDYISLNDSLGELFVSHGTIVQVVNADDGKLLGAIPNTIGVHGIAFANEINYGFTSNGRDTSVTVFRLSDLKSLAKIKVTGQNPDAILYDPFSKKLFTFNGRTSNCTAIDVLAVQTILSTPQVTNSKDSSLFLIDNQPKNVINTISLEGKPEFAVTDGNGKIFVNIENKSKIVEINSNTLVVEQSWSIAPGKEPSGIAIDNENHRLFSVCSNKLMVVLDANDGHVITTVPIGEHPDAAAFDIGLKRAYSSNGEGTITVVQEADKDNFKVLENIVTQKSARTMAVSQKTHHMYLPAAEVGPPPEPTADNPHPRPTIKPGSFVILDVAPLK